MEHQIITNSRDGSSAAEANANPAGNEIRTCHNYWCNYSTDQTLSQCPKCGRALLTPETYRLLGLVLAFLGGLLAFAGALLLIFAGPRLVGSMGAKLFAWGVFGLLLVVGLTIMTAGFWQVIFGKRSQSLMTYVIALITAIMVIAAIGRAIL